MNAKNQKILYLFFTCFLLALSGQANKDSINYPEQNAYTKRLYDIKNATVLLNVFGKRGTGTLVKDPLLRDSPNSPVEYYILTNAHVCIDNFKLYLSEKKYSSNYQKLKTTMMVYGKKGQTQITVKNTSKEFNLYQDVCLVKVNPKDFSPKIYSFVSLYSSNDVVKIANNKEDKTILNLFTRNYTDSDSGEVFIKKGTRTGFINHEFQIRINGTKKKDKIRSYWRGPASISSLDVIPGDSGSAIYDYKLDMVGLAFGTRLTNTKYDIEELDQFLASKKISHNKISKLENEIKEISGLYIPLKDRRVYEKENNSH